MGTTGVRVNEYDQTKAMEMQISLSHHVMQTAVP